MLDTLATPSDLRKLNLKELEELSEEVRKKIIDVVSVNGGHLSSNLGIVELTVALHYVFNSPKDQLIFDVSHQAYPHKLLTGREKTFSTIRQHNGLCGFTHPYESPHDHFFAGHAGTALSLGLGSAKARDLVKKEHHVIPILGDASLTCGLTLEAMNNIPKDLSRFLVVLNDNNMSISQNVGAITHILSRLLSNPTSNKIFYEIDSLLRKIPRAGEILAKQGHKWKESIKNLVSAAPFFEQFGLSYVGPIDGHNIEKLIDTFTALKDNPVPTIVHVLTTKGKGMKNATNNPTGYHGCRPFDKMTGVFHQAPSKPTFPKIFGKHLLSMGAKDPSIVAITPAMTAGSCLDDFLTAYPDRCFDVGIAEGHAVTFAGALAKKENLKVVCSIYATFLQRALDNLFHDVVLQRSPVVFAIDRGGISGPDGSTHHGIYDISFLQAMPNLVICQPRNGHVLKELLESAFSWNKTVAIRYPNMTTEEEDLEIQKRQLGQGEILHLGEDLLIISLGHMNKIALDLQSLLQEDGFNATVVDPVFIKPLDEALLEELISTHKYIVTIEEHSLRGGLGTAIALFISTKNLSPSLVLHYGIPDEFLEHGSYLEVLSDAGLTLEKIHASLLKVIPKAPALIGTL